MSSETGGAPGVPLLTLRTGAQLGRYTLVGLLGQGGMAAVYRAHDPTLGRDVAIKVMSPVVAIRPESAERFRREARAVAALAHPGVIKVHDFVPSDGELPAYLVEELIEGPTLTALVEQRGGKILPEVAIAIALAVAEALAAAHARGIVHRDVKPENVMIDRAGGGARVVLTDFGVAHVSGLESMTATGALVGSPAYMAPEQARGQAVGAPADLWAVGVMLYQLATGTLPFPGRDPLTVLAAVARGTFARPSQYEPRVGPALEAVIARLLRSAPSERYADANALATELRALAAEAELDDVGRFLRGWLDDPAGVEKRLGPRIADTACTRAKKALSSGATARALAEIGRATAYVPEHPEAARLLAALGTRRRLRTIAWAALGAALMTGVAWGGVTALRRAPTPPAATVELTKTPVKPATTPSPVVAAQKAELKAEPLPDKEAQAPVTASIRTTRKKSASGRAPSPVAAVATPPANAPAPEAQPTPTAVTAPPPPPRPLWRGRVKLGAQHFFCLPSLDDAVARLPTPLYEDVPAGPHKVYCTRPGGTRDLVGEFELAEGVTAVHKTVLREPDASGRRLVDAAH